jgi:GTP-binding protein
MVTAELGRYSERLAGLPRWLVINKIDLVADDQRAARMAAVTGSLDWDGPVFAVSAATGEGTKQLVREVANYLRTLP